MALDLPRGCVDLVRTGHLSGSSMQMLHSFAEWHKTYRQSHDSAPSPEWRYPAPLQKLNVLEKSIFVGLLCLTDDTSHLSLHASATIYRQAKKRAEMLVALQHLWTDPALADCLVWLWMVTLTPRGAEDSLGDIQRQLFQWLVLLRGTEDLFDWDNV
ncbi:hypothetical protein BJX64DRAFT_288038 [Aspergillus heterothallicus]